MTASPRSTYRLQLTPEFTLHDAAAETDYLWDLGVDWVYLSPVLQATTGSTHGYDVVDHSRIDEARGGAAGLAALAKAARIAGLGVLIDIVPNHMGVGDPMANPWWWDVLAVGRNSAWASTFDVDWDAAAGRVRIPILGETVASAAASGTLTVDATEQLLRYHEHRFPIAAGTADDGAPAEVVHGRQHYELIEWRDADRDLNYRRFFSISDLAGVRVERPEVFAATHAEIIRWVRSGLGAELPVGLRIDHPDGLAHPAAYLDDLATATDGAYVVVEKVLQLGEDLPASWATAGTTGYDALAEVDRLFVDPAGGAALTAMDASLRPEPHDWHDLTHATRRAVVDGLLLTEVRRLAAEVAAALAESPPASVVIDALGEVLACYPVYRSYLPIGQQYLDAAIADATERRPDLAAVIERLAPVLADPTQAAAIRFQQTSGMVMAKGIEDTAFYRDARLTSLNEVGGDPDRFALTADEFHAAQRARLAQHPTAMTALTTHDTKRGEDTRARINVLAEIPDEWAAFLDRRGARGGLDNLLWQAVVGCWPKDRAALHEYAIKAARESGHGTSWADADPRFEATLGEFIDAVFDDAEVTHDVDEFTRGITAAGWSNALGAKLLQLTGPGVPDVYQGSELWDFSLVDPDNRRPVDYARRRRMLVELDAGAVPPLDTSGAAKLLVTSRALRARRDRPDLFASYTPLAAYGHAARHVVAVDRGGAIPIVTRLPVWLARAGGWSETQIDLPSGSFRDALTGAVFRGSVDLGAILARYPVALLLSA